MGKFGKGIVIYVFILIMETNCRPTNYPSDVPPAKKPKVSPARCSLWFSEINLDFSNSESLLPFIELKAACERRPGPRPTNQLSDFILFVLNGRPLSLHGVINFQNYVLREDSQYIVVGSPKLSPVDVSLSAGHVQSVFSRTIDNLMLPNPSRGNYAFILTQGISKMELRRGRLATTLGHDGKVYSKLLTTDGIKIIIEKAVDMVVLGSDRPELLQEYFNFWQPKHNGPMFNENWQSFAASNLNQGWSMCKDTYKGFDAEAFEVQDISPGQPNKCNIAQDQNTLLVSIETDSQCRSAEEEYNTPIHHKITESMYENMKTFEFHPQWIAQCEQFLPRRENLLQKADLHAWLKIDPGETICTFTCVPCQMYLDLGFRSDLKRKPLIVTKGYFAKDIYSNSDMIKSHADHPLHKESMPFFENMRSTSIIEESHQIIRNLEKEERKFLNATMNLILISYVELKAGASFLSHETYMKSLRLVGANVGWLHHTDEAVPQIAKIISATFQVQLLQYLVKNQPPFSLLADSSTSFNQPFLIVYFQTLEDGYPVMHYYSLIYLSDGEKSEELTYALIRQVETDSKLVPGFMEYFKKKLVTIVTDGASNMVGVHNSFKTHLMDYIERGFTNVVCMAHKLDNAFKKGIKFEPSNNAATNSRSLVKQSQLKYFESFEKSTNDIYTFYASRGHKKWLHLQATAEEVGIIPRRIKYVYSIRWSDSHFRALETLHHNYYAIIEDLEKITQDPNFELLSKNTAQRLHDRLTDKTFMLVFHEFLDILSIFKTASKQFQEGASIIIGKIQIVKQVLNSLDELRENYGSWLKDFLGNCLCVGGCNGGTCTLNEYDDCNDMFLNHVSLHRQLPVVAYYSEIRVIVLNNLISSIHQYFNIKVLEYFELFNPEMLNFQSTYPSVFKFEDLYKPPLLEAIDPGYTTYEQRLVGICEFYHISSTSCQQLRIDWESLLVCLLTSDHIRDHSTTDPTRFWPFAFTQCVKKWTPITRQIVENSLVTPYSSAECERGFSIMNNLKTKSRSSLDKDTLGALMRIKINGPDVDNIDVYGMTLEYLKHYSRVDDPDFKGGRKPSEEGFCDMFKKSRIYS